MTEEEKQRIWEWSGLCYHDWHRVKPNYECSKCGRKILTVAITTLAYLPYAGRFVCANGEDDGELTLDNLFKHAVTKLIQDRVSDGWRVEDAYRSLFDAWFKELMISGERHIMGATVHPTQALIKVILKVIDA